VDFDAQSPFLGRPYIELQSRNGSNDSRTLALSEGEQAAIALNGNSFIASRESDSDNYKSMSLAVVR
jgi:hypothetical protein